MIGRLRHGWRDNRGGALVEFAVLLPLILTLGMGLIELAYQAYVQAILTGVVQKAGRDSTIENADTDAIDARVLAAIRQINGNASFSTGYPLRMSYADYGSIMPESFTDTNGNGKRDSGECFTDINGNQTWDADPGVAGGGNANDTVVYTVKMTYPRLFPVTQWMGWSKTTTLTAATALKNQPWSGQTTFAASTVCT
jgi:Flp pilus assembly protein TadG